MLMNKILLIKEKIIVNNKKTKPNNTSKTQELIIMDFILAYEQLLNKYAIS